jgi:hypothetical protein
MSSVRQVRCRTGTAIALIVAALVGRSRSANAEPTPALEDLLDRVGRYVQRLEENWAVVISDEAYRQDVWKRPPAGAVGGLTHTSRSIRSEMLFMWLSQENVGLSIRNVLIVDGHPITDSKERLDRALAAPGFDYVAQLRRLQAESARFNVGQVWRTTGNPSLVLRFLLPANQSYFTFSRAGDTRVDGETVTKLAFAEREHHPTAIDFNGEDVLSRGAIWIHSADGRISRTTLQLSTRTLLDVSVTVDFQFDSKLALSLPSRMEEHYNDAGRRELTTCSATYSNYRRFETSGRLITPQ